ncbi:MAG TPA: helix-turn-helix transcriptional regulator [Caulobacteraceae bacterium]|jgi:AraC-like DNA-binding protein
MKPWTFATEDHPLAERAGAWSEAMAGLGLSKVELAAGAAPRGRITGLTSPLGMEFALIEAGPQTIHGPLLDLPAAIWLMALIEGRVHIADGCPDTRLSGGDVLYGPVGRSASLALETRSRLLWIRAPRMALGHRLIGAGGLSIGRLTGDQGLAGVLSSLLAGVAARLADLTQNDLKPIESALTEFLTAILAGLPGAETARGALQISRVSQIVETMLPEAELTLKGLAEASGLAPRTLQKLLAAAGQTFAGYVRDRRLERCRAELASPLALGQSIGEIALRWGFSDPAYFSRAFRNAYGASPRDFRRAAENA